jgi:hypothetical protein
MIKEMDCFNYFPGDVTIISRQDFNGLLSRVKWYKIFLNGIWLGGPGDHQRQTEFYYIYHSDNMLGGK